MRELNLAADLFEKEISDAKISLDIYYKPELRIPAISHFIAEAVIEVYRPTCARHAQDAADRANMLLKKINDQFWNHTWSCHDNHFHENFTKYARCPYTCAEELVEMLRKIGQS